MDRIEFSKTVKKLIARAHNDKAIELLFSLAERESNHELYNVTTLIANAFEDVKRKEILDLPFDSRIKNKITKSLIEIVSKIEKGERFSLDSQSSNFGYVIQDFLFNEAERKYNLIVISVSMSTAILAVVFIFGLNVILFLILLIFVLEYEGDIEP